MIDAPEKGCPNQTKSLLGIETINQFRHAQIRMRPNQTKSLLGIETSFESIVSIKSRVPTKLNPS